MIFDVLQASVMSGPLGDIFWDLAPWIVYDPGFDLGCNIYVANNTSTAKEYALMARLSRGSMVISDEALPVFGYTWFTVDPGDLVTLKGALRFSDSNADLTVSLIERESGAATDAVVTQLVQQTNSSLPPSWPGTPGTPGTTQTNWNSMLGMMMPVLMLGMLGMVVVSASRLQKETVKLPSGR
jgi:hypothetical protein